MARIAFELSPTVPQVPVQVGYRKSPFQYRRPTKGKKRASMKKYPLCCNLGTTAKNAKRD